MILDELQNNLALELSAVAFSVSSRARSCENIRKRPPLHWVPGLTHLVPQSQSSDVDNVILPQPFPGSAMAFAAQYDELDSSGLVLVVRGPSNGPPPFSPAASSRLVATAIFARPASADAAIPLLTSGSAVDFARLLAPRAASSPAFTKRRQCMSGGPDNILPTEFNAPALARGVSGEGIAEAESAWRVAAVVAQSSASKRPRVEGKEGSCGLVEAYSSQADAQKGGGKAPSLDSMDTVPEYIVPSPIRTGRPAPAPPADAAPAPTGHVHLYDVPMDGRRG